MNIYEYDLKILSENVLAGNVLHLSDNSEHFLDTLSIHLIVAMWVALAVNFKNI